MSTLLILFNSFLKSSTDKFLDAMLLDKSFTLSILSKLTVLLETRRVNEYNLPLLINIMSFIF